MNKGFTLFETLAVILILGILVTIVVFSANKLIRTGNSKYYNTSEQMMILASKEYFTDYRSYLPKEINQSTRVLLSALVSENYIDIIKDVNEEECNTTNSYVEVTKVSEKKYIYKAHLVCDKSNYETKDRE